MSHNKLIIKPKYPQVAQQAKGYFLICGTKGVDQTTGELIDAGGVIDRSDCVGLLDVI